MVGRPESGCGPLAGASARRCWNGSGSLREEKPFSFASAAYIICLFPGIWLYHRLCDRVHPALSFLAVLWPAACFRWGRLLVSSNGKNSRRRWWAFLVRPTRMLSPISTCVCPLQLRRCIRSSLIHCPAIRSFARFRFDARSHIIYCTQRLNCPSIFD